MRSKLVITSVVIALILFAHAAGYCKAIKPTDDNTLCKADLDTEGCIKFQEILAQFGHNFIVLEGVALGTMKQVKEKTFAVILKCSDRQGNINIVGIKFVKDKLTAIEVKATGERAPGI